MTLEHGPLALCKGSHLWDGYDTLMKGTEEIPETFRVQESKWYSPEELREGDFIMFHNKTLHASLVNKSGQYRVSVDTRWLTNL